MLNTIKVAPKEMKTLVATMASYRLAQESQNNTSTLPVALCLFATATGSVPED